MRWSSRTASGGLLPVSAPVSPFLDTRCSSLPLLLQIRPWCTQYCWRLADPAERCRGVVIVVLPTLQARTAPAALPACNPLLYPRAAAVRPPTFTRRSSGAVGSPVAVPWRVSIGFGSPRPRRGSCCAQPRAPFHPARPGQGRGVLSPGTPAESTAIHFVALPVCFCFSEREQLSVRLDSAGMAPLVMLLLTSGMLALVPVHARSVCYLT